VSQRNGGGMTAVLTPTRSIAEMEKALLLKTDPAAPNAASAEPPASPEEQGREVAPAGEQERPAIVKRKSRAVAQKPVEAAVDEILGELVPTTTYEVLHTRIPDWLDDALEDKYLTLKRGNPQMTKQAIVTFALIKVLGVTPPDGFSIF
jgi:hypothetical protein